MTVLELSLTVFTTQLIFTWGRTWNIKEIARKNVKGVAISGSLIHIMWLISLSIGAVSIKEVMMDFNFEYIPVVLCSLVGGTIGSIIRLKN